MKSNKPRGLNRNKIRKLYNDGYSISALTRKFDCRYNAIMHHIYDLVIPVVSMSRNNNKLNEVQVVSIRNKYIYGGYSAPMLAKEYNVSESTILNTIHGIYYRYIPGEIILKDGTIITIVKGFGTDKPINTKGNKKLGPKIGKPRRKNGCLIPLEKKYGVSKATICRWLNSGKIKESKYKKYKK